MTGLQKYVPESVKQGFGQKDEVHRYLKNAEQGAATTVYAALSKEWEGKGGKYLEDCGEARQTESDSILALGYAPHAFDEQAEKRLWADSLKFVGLEDDS